MIGAIILTRDCGDISQLSFMDEGKKKKIKIVVIILVIILSIIALVETGLLLSMRSKLDQINSDNSQIQNRLENS